MNFNPRKILFAALPGLVVAGFLAFATRKTSITTPTENGLVGYWKFDEGTGNIAYDSSGNNNHLILKHRLSENIFYHDQSLDNVYFSSLDWGDFDNDGWPDLVLIGQTATGSIAKIYRNNNGTLIEHQSLTGQYLGDVVWGDINKDGYLDLVVSGNATNTIFYRNDNGFFTVAQDNLPLIGNSALDLGDFNNDGYLDLAMTGWKRPDNVDLAKIYRYDPDTETFVFHQDLSRIANGGTINFGDFDNDGDLDLVLTGWREIQGGGNITSIFQNNNGTFTEIQTLTGVSASSLDTADYDGDGDLDIVLCGLTAGYGGGPVSKVYRNNNGSFVEDTSQNLLGVGYCSVAWAKNSDGSLVLVLAGYAGGNYYTKIYRNYNGILIETENLIGVAGTSIGGLHNHSFTAWADYDNDGSLDLAITGDTATSGYITWLYKNTHTLGAQWTNGKLGSALNFDATKFQYGYVEDSPSLSITGDLTISAWIKPESNTADTLFNIVGKWNGIYQSYLLTQYGDELRMYIDSVSNYKTSNAANLNTGIWYYVAAVYKATTQTITLYINGLEVEGTVSGTIPNSIGDDPGRLQIGAQDSTSIPINFYNGLIDEVRIYNRALSAEEISQIYNSSPKRAIVDTSLKDRWAEGLVLLQTFDGQDMDWSATTAEAKDQSGYGNHGDVIGAVPVPGKVGQALSFDGVDDYVKINDSNSLDITGNMTMEAWIKRDSTTNYYYAILFKQGAYGFEFANNRLNFVIPGIVDITSPGAPLTDTLAFHHVAVTRSGTDGNWQYTFYMDGELNGQVNDTNNINASSYILTIGTGWSGTGPFFDGLIDEVRIYNRALSGEEIKEHYQAGKRSAEIQ